MFPAVKSSNTADTSFYRTFGPRHTLRFRYNLPARCEMASRLRVDKSSKRSCEILLIQTRFTALIGAWNVKTLCGDNVRPMRNPLMGVETLLLLPTCGRRTAGSPAGAPGRS